MPHADIFRARSGQLPERADIPARYKWDLSAICRDLDEWAACFGTLEAEIDGLRAFEVEAKPLEAKPPVPAALPVPAFAAGPGWLAAMQIGDGLFVLRAPAGGYELLFTPDRGEYHNETTFVTTPGAQTRRQVCVREQPIDFLCAATDGIERICIRYQDWAPHAPFFKPLDDYMQSFPGPEQSARDLAEFLTREKMRTAADDDRSLLLCAYRQ